MPTISETVPTTTFVEKKSLLRVEKLKRVDFSAQLIFTTNHSDTLIDRWITNYIKRLFGREAVVAQLVEWSLSIPEVRSLNPVIGKIYVEYLFTLFAINCIEKTKINKRGRKWPTLKKEFLDPLKKNVTDDH